MSTKLLEIDLIFRSTISASHHSFSIQVALLYFPIRNSNVSQITIQVLDGEETDMAADYEVCIPWKWNWLCCWYHEYFLLPNNEAPIDELCGSCLLLHVADMAASYSFQRQ